MENDIKKDVLVSVTGRQEGADMDTEPISLISQGRLYRKGRQYFVSYDESALTGLEGTHTTVKLDGEEVSVIRTGKYPSQMVFKHDNKSLTVYRTDYGPLTVVINTKKVSSTLCDDGGVIDVLYEIEIENEPAYANHLLISVEVKD